LGTTTAKRFFVYLALIAAAGLALRLTYLLGFTETSVSGDGMWYHLGANYLADGKGFLNPYAYRFGGITTPGADHPPGWTVFLATASLVGLRSWRAHTVVACLVGTATIPTMGLAGRRLAGPRTGLVAALIAALYPYFWMYEAQLLSETLVILVVAIAILLALRFRDSPTLRRAVAVGAVCGVLTLIRAEQLLLLGFLVVPLTMLASGVPLRRRLGWFAAALAAGILVITPWTVFNLVRYQKPTYLTTNFGSALSSANCDATYHGPALGYWDPACLNEANASVGVKSGFFLPVQLAIRHEDGSVLDAAQGRQGLSYARGHLGDLPLVVLAREGRTWSVFRPFQQMHVDLIKGHIWVIRAGFFAYWLLAALALGGAIVLLRRKMSLWVLGAFLATVIVATAITFGQTRYRAPADASIVLLAAVAIDRLLRGRRPVEHGVDGGGRQLGTPCA
jgi:4-amino-4-deoxy-L-arabinose transferase-like glycosyltransferase